MKVTTDDAERGAGVAGRLGFVARGSVYCLLGIVAIHVAFSGKEQALDRHGALRLMARQPFGVVVLVALATGFASYALWRLARAAAEKWPKGLLHVGRAVLYSGFTYSTIRLTLGRESGPSADEQAKTWTARVLAHDGGRLLVIAIGAGLIVAGAVLCWRGAHRSFEKKLRLSAMRGWQRRWLPWLGTAGHAARGVVFGLMGAFLVRAAVQFDPDEAVGVDGALHQLAARPYGRIGLLATAIGLVAFGLFCFVQACWRQELEDA